MATMGDKTRRRALSYVKTKTQNFSLELANKTEGYALLDPLHY
jgi:hypothetical protein